MRRQTWYTQPHFCQQKDSNETQSVNKNIPRNIPLYQYHCTYSTRDTGHVSEWQQQEHKKTKTVWMTIYI